MITLADKRIGNTNGFKKGQKPWNTGKIDTWGFRYYQNNKEKLCQ